MELYTFNATPVRGENSGKKNSELIRHYPQRVASILEVMGIDGFTIYKVMGYWKGEPEVSFKIEIASNHLEYGILATKLRDEYHQDSVMVTLPNKEVIFY